MRYLWLSVLFSFVLWAKGPLLPEHFSANFEQTITNPKGKVIHYKGSVLYGGESRMKWHYTTPTKKEVCTDGKALTVVDHDLEQVSFYQVKKPFNLQEILKKAKPYKKEIYLAVYEGKTYTVKVDAKGRIESAAYYDDLDNKVQILFRKVRYGKGRLPRKKTQCHYPSSYDIIRG